MLHLSCLHLLWEDLFAEGQTDDYGDSEMPVGMMDSIEEGDSSGYPVRMRKGLKQSVLSLLSA